MLIGCRAVLDEKFPFLLLCKESNIDKGDDDDDDDEGTQVSTDLHTLLEQTITYETAVDEILSSFQHLLLKSTVDACLHLIESF